MNTCGVTALHDEHGLTPRRVARHATSSKWMRDHAEDPHSCSNALVIEEPEGVPICQGCNR